MINEKESIYNNIASEFRNCLHTFNTEGPINLCYRHFSIEQFHSITLLITLLPKISAINPEVGFRNVYSI